MLSPGMAYALVGCTTCMTVPCSCTQKKASSSRGVGQVQNSSLVASRFSGKSACELKYFDTSGEFAEAIVVGPPRTNNGMFMVSSVLVGSGGSGIAPGVGASGRIGRKICLKKLELLYSVTNEVVKVDSQTPAPPTTATKIAPQERTGFVAVWLDRQPNGGLAPVGEIYETTVHPVRCFPNISNNERFQMLGISWFHLSANAYQVSDTTNEWYSIAAHVHGSLMIDSALDDIAVMYQLPSVGSPTGAISEIVSNQILLVCGTQVPHPNAVYSGENFYAVSPPIHVKWATRLRYEDD